MAQAAWDIAQGMTLVLHGEGHSDHARESYDSTRDRTETFRCLVWSDEQYMAAGYWQDEEE